MNIGGMVANLGISLVKDAIKNIQFTSEQNKQLLNNLKELQEKHQEDVAKGQAFLNEFANADDAKRNELLKKSMGL